MDPNSPPWNGEITKIKRKGIGGGMEREKGRIGS